MARYVSLDVSLPGRRTDARQILGGEELSHLKTLAEKHGGDAEKLLESTYEGEFRVARPTLHAAGLTGIAEIKQVLKNKVAEAKKVAAGAKDDVKKEAKK